MRSRTWRLGVALALVIATMPAGAGADDGDTPQLRLRQATFSPLDPDHTATRARADARDIDLYIVQFDGPIPTEARAELEAGGLRVLSYLPDFAYRVQASPAGIAAAEARPDVVGVSLFEPVLKLDPAIGSAADTGVYRVRVVDGADAAAVRAAVRAGSMQVVSFARQQMTVLASPEQLLALADHVDVAWISPFRFAETHNEFGAGVIMGADTAVALGYDGSTQIVAVADTGIGDGTAAGAHRDIPADRIVAIHDWPTSNAPGCYRPTNDGAQDPDSGHGTHVAASVLGGGGPNGEGMGTAPGASLVFQAVEDWIRTGGTCAASPDGYYLTGLPDDLTDLFQQAYDDGARIHSNSWGSSVDGEYTSDAATVDTFIWNNPDMLITTSAGNAGIDADSNGTVDDDSIGSPATAKNLLTVGASENDRQGDWVCDAALTYTNPNTGTSCSSQGGTNDLFTWGDAWPDDFPADPIASDASAGNAEQLAAFSSRGPTDDGRIKPDVVAPGSWVLSGYSDLYQEGYDGATNPQNSAFQYDGWGFPVDEHYKYMGGTSMSNPLVAGAAAVVRDFYEKTDGHSASAALTKATLINSAVDLLDENNDGADDNDFPIPNSHEGWGRVDVGAAVDGTAWYADSDAVSTGGTVASTHTVDAGTPLRVTLVWSDYPSDETAAVNLVNDLDLVVTSPSGQDYLGNVFSNGWAAVGGSADRLNNVENVYVEAPAAGTWTVTVSGFNVPFGPQPFALVVDAAFDGAPPVDDPPTVSVDSPAAGATVSGTVTITATADDDNGVDQVEFRIDGATIGTDTDGTDGWSLDWDTTSATDADHTIDAVATDTIGQTATDTITVTVDNAIGGPTSMHVGDLDGTSLDSGSRWIPELTVTVHDDAEGAVENATVSVTMTASTRTFSYSCVTDAAGVCTLTGRELPDGRVDLVTMDVTDVTHATLTYGPADNHDPDADSDGSSIVIAQ